MLQSLEGVAGSFLISNDRVLRRIGKRVLSPRTRVRLAFARTSARRPTARWRALPNLLIIGAQRCGTSSLFKYLSAHPRCKPSIRKEVRFFTEYYTRGEDWYRSHFPLGVAGHRGAPAIYFEASPDYLLDPRVPSRVTQLLPDVRLIVILRNPIERAYSHYRHLRRLGMEELSFEEALRREPERIQQAMENLHAHPDHPIGGDLLRYSYVERGRYARQLEHWLEVVDRSRLLVLSSERFFSETDRVFQSILSFLGLPEWRPVAYRNFSYSNPRPVPPEMPAECQRFLMQQLAPELARLEGMGVLEPGLIEVLPSGDS